MKTHKVIASLVAAALVIGVAGTALADHNATVPGAVYGNGQGQQKDHKVVKEELDKAGVKDVDPANFAAAAIAVAIEAGLITPDANGNVNPNASVGSNDGIAIFAKVLGIASKKDDAATAAKKAKDAGLVSETGADRDMTRLEVAHLLGKALGATSKPFVDRASYPFNDYDAQSPEDRAMLAALYDLGIFKGFEDRTFRPDGVLTKAQIAILIDRILGA